MSFYRDQLENWLKGIDVKGDLVLDVGGASNPVKKRVKSWEVADYKILDNGIENGEKDIVIDLNYPENRIELEGRADIVFCLEVFEYIWNPVRALANIFSYLKKGGRAYITFPFVYPHHEPVQHDYLRYTMFGVRKLLQEAGFEKNICYPRLDRSGKLMEFYRADGMHPSKQFPDHHVTGFMVEATK